MYFITILSFFSCITGIQSIGTISTLRKEGSDWIIEVAARWLKLRPHQQLPLRETIGTSLIQTADAGINKQIQTVHRPAPSVGRVLTKRLFPSQDKS